MFPGYSKALPLLFLLGLGGCFSLYGDNAGGKIELERNALRTYLEKAELARPQTVQAVLTKLRNGERYRERILDQRNRWCLATIWVAEGQQNVLHVVTARKETCANCNGTGKRKWVNPSMQNLPFDTRCLTCKGKGHLEHHTVERKYVLSSLDFENPNAAQQAFSRSTLGAMPAETKEQIDRLANSSPKERLAACLWLDRHYVKKGQHFQELLPMLRKARWQESSEEKRLMLWQFHAGKGMPGEYRRAYYRIYADKRTGKVIRKDFYPEN